MRRPCSGSRLALLRSASAVLALASLFPATRARAQQATQIAERQDFAIERFRLALDREGLLGFEGAAAPEHLSLELGLWLGFARDPLVVFRRASGERLGGLVEGRLGGSLVASLGLFGFAELGVELPVVLAQTRPAAITGIAGALPTLSGFGLGGPRLVPKLQLLHQEDHGVNLACMTAFVLPSLGDGGYFAQDGFTFEPSVALGRTFGRLRTGAELGARFRRTKSIADLVVEHELFGALGAGYGFDVATRRLELDATLSAATSAVHPFDLPGYLELLGGLSYEVAQPLVTFLAAGAGLAHGVGSPDWRVLVGMRVGLGGGREEPAPLARTEPAVDHDPDRDGVLDWDDRCPTVKGPVENRGCPDEDRDHDLIVDRLDHCPDLAEDRDGFQDDDGCPELDDDGDGIADAVDKCPREPGPAENGGCADIDRDEDGVPDRLDNCPKERGDWANRGCAKKQLVAIGRGKIEILDKVYFETAKAIIQARSFALLDDVADVILRHPELGKVIVEGHTDDQGDDTSNLKLSDRRAAAVRAYLVKKGVAEGRLDAKGYGETRPIATNRTPEGRAENRRVEFRLIEQSSVVE